MKRLLALFVAASIAAFVPACGSPPPPPPKKAIGAEWQDVFDLTPAFYAVVRPQAIKRDPVYGPLWKTVLRIAQARSELSGITGAEVIEGAEEIIAGVDGHDDVVLVFRGVPANLDPKRMTGQGGRALFTPVDERAKVVELTRNGGGDASVFVLPDRTWVVASGVARQRARQAYATPFGRPVPKLDPSALAAIRLDAETMIVPRAGKSPSLGPLTRKLSSLTVALLPGKQGLVATLQYQDDDASAWAEAHARRVLDEIGRIDPAKAGRIAFLKTARLSREGNAVSIRADLPARLLEELPNARGEEITW